MNTAEVLRVAAARVRQGWCQGIHADGKGGVCALSALSAVTGYLVDYNSAYCVLASCIGHVNAVSTWNDAEGQTAENVAVGMEYAALCWEQQQQLEQPKAVEAHA